LQGAAVPIARQTQQLQQPQQQQQAQQQQQQQQQQQLSHAQAQAQQPQSLQPWAAPFADPFAAFGALAPFVGGALGGGELMGQALGELARVQQRALAALPGPMRVDVVETDAEFRVVADLPGAQLADVKIELGDDRVLRISAEQRGAAFEQDETRGGVTYHRAERSSGRQWRSLQLPAGVDASKLSARLDRGVLCVCAPKHAAGAEGAGRRRIEVTQAAHAAPCAGGACVGDGACAGGAKQNA